MPSGTAETSLSKPPIEFQGIAFTRHSLQHALSSTQPPKHPDSLRHTPPQQLPHAHGTENLKFSKNLQLNPTINLKYSSSYHSQNRPSIKAPALLSIMSCDICEEEASQLDEQPFRHLQSKRQPHLTG